MTLTTGTSPHDSLPDDGDRSQQAMYSNDYHGDGLAWIAVIDATREFLAEATVARRGLRGL